MNQSMLTLRGYFIQADLVQQGFMRRIGRGSLHAVIPVDNTRVIVITKGGAALIDLSAREILWEIDCSTVCGALNLESEVLVLGGGSKISVWDLRTGAEALEPRKHGARSMAFRPDGRQVVACGWSGVHLWEVISGRELWHVPERSTGAVAFSSDGRLIASGNDKAITLRDAASGRELKQLLGHNTDVNSLVFSPNGRLLASTGSDGFIRLWDVAGGQEVHHLECSKYQEKISFSPNGQLLAVSSDAGGYTRVWNVVSLANPRQGTPPAAPAASSIQSQVLPCRATALAFSPDSKTLITGHRNSVHQWDLSTGMENAQFTWDALESEILAFHSNGQTLAAGGEKSVTIWNSKTGQPLHNLPLEKTIRDMVFSPNGHLLAVLLEYNEVHVWDTHTWQLHTKVHFRNLIDEAPYGQGFYGKRLMFRADGHYLAVIGVRALHPRSTRNNYEIYVWDVVTWQAQEKLDTPPLLDGDMLLSSSWRYLIHQGLVWDLQTQNTVQRLEGIGSVSDGEWVVSHDFRFAARSDSMRVDVWEIESGRYYPVHGANGTGAWRVRAFTPDGTMVIAGSVEDLAFWPYVGMHSRPKHRFPDAGIVVAISPTGQWFASTTRDGIVRIWSMPSS